MRRSRSRPTRIPRPSPTGTEASPTVSAEAETGGTRIERSAVGGTDVSGEARTARQDGRAIDQLRPVSFERDYTVMAPGSVLVTFGQTKVLCTASVEERVPPWMRGHGPGLGDRRVLHAAGFDARAGLPGGGQGQAVGPDAGDPAPHRPLAACGVRPRRPGRGADHRGLRRAAGRRRHAHGLHLRGLRRAARRLHPPGAGRDDPRASADRLGGGGLGRHRRRRRRCSTCPTPRTRGPRST